MSHKERMFLLHLNVNKTGILSFFDERIKPIYIFILLLAGFIILKIPHLYLPFYWDEAWVYGKAVRSMADNGLGMDANTLPPELGRGHPLLFHNLFALFLKVTDNTIFCAHLFALIVSCTLLFVLFRMLEEIIGKFAGVFAAALLMVQPVFVAQSVLVLPEVMLSLFILLSIWMYLHKKYLLFFLSSAAAMLVKESAIVLFLSLGLCEVIHFFKEKNAKETFLHLLKINAGLLPWILFLLVQKQQLGYYFFPEHTGYMSFKGHDIMDKLNRGFSFTFLYQGRNILFVSLLILACVPAYQRIKNKVSLSIPYKVLAALLSFIFCFLIFSSVNFFSDRYFTCCVIVFMALASAILFLITKNYFIRLTIVLLAFTSGIVSHFLYSSNSDHNLGYTNSVKLYQRTTDYLYENLKREDTIYAFFNLNEDLISQYPGYIKKGQITFTNLHLILNDNCRYFVISNVENESDKEIILKKYKPVLIKKIMVGQAWAEIWKK